MFHTIQLDKPRNIKFGMKAIKTIEAKHKKPISNIDMNNFTMEDTAYFIWAGLQHEDKDLTPNMVMDLIDEHLTIKEMYDAVTAAMEQAFGKEKKEDADADDSEKNA